MIAAPLHPKSPEVNVMAGKWQNQDSNPGASLSRPMGARRLLASPEQGLARMGHVQGQARCQDFRDALSSAWWEHRRGSP